jgi:hypothetical protein
MKLLLRLCHRRQPDFRQLAGPVALVAGLVKSGVAKFALTVLELEPMRRIRSKLVVSATI